MAPSASPKIDFDDFFVFADNFGKSGTYVTLGTQATTFTSTVDEAQAGQGYIPEAFVVIARFAFGTVHPSRPGVGGSATHGR